MATGRRLELQLNPSAASNSGATPAAVGKLVALNSPKPIRFTTEGFDGEMLFLHRPSPEPEHGNWPYAEVFRTKERRFEWRVQGKFTIDPGNGVHFGVDIDTPVQLSWALRRTSGWLLAIMEMLSSARGHGFSYSLEHVETADGSIIRPHIAFPLCAADSIVITPPGETPPCLTGTFDPTPSDKRLGVCGNTTDVFTFVYWSKYIDFVRWEIMNMPLGWRCSFTEFIGDAPLQMLVYRLEDPNVLHTKSNQRNLVRLAMVSLADSADAQMDIGNDHVHERSLVSEDRHPKHTVNITTKSMRRGDGCCGHLFRLPSLQCISGLLHYLKH